MVVAPANQSCSRTMSRSPVPRPPAHNNKDLMGTGGKENFGRATNNAVMLINRTADSGPVSCNKASSGGGDDLPTLRSYNNRFSNNTNFLTFNRPKNSMCITDRSLTISELQKVHETMELANFCEPTNEQMPNRPKRSLPMTHEALQKRMELAHEASRLSTLNGCRTETMKANRNLGIEF